MRILIEAGNGRVALAQGRIVEAEGDFDHVIQLPGGEVSSGLINAHDHLWLNHFGRLGAPLYTNAYQWAADIQDRHREIIAAGRAVPRRQALLHGAWKNLLAGVTRVVHHDLWEKDFGQDFPIDVIRLAFADSLGMNPNFSPQPGELFALHVAEGVDRRAADEIRTLAARGLLNRNMLAVHAVGADEAGVVLLRASGSALVWCPTSNQFLFGRSVPDALLAEGMDVLLGSDSLLTGAGSLLEEIGAARGRISDARLLDAVGLLAARRLGLAPPSLAVGSNATLAVFRKPLLDSGRQDVVLVMTDGVLRVLDPDLLALLNPSGGQLLEWRGVRRWIAEDTVLRL